jgi:hypothetical protein
VPEAAIKEHCNAGTGKDEVWSNAHIIQDDWEVSPIPKASCV